MTNYLGEIRIFAGDYAPQDWHLCDGAVLQISEYDALYALIGNTYGGSSGSTFALPDLRGRIPVGQGSSQQGSRYRTGQTGGTKTVTVTASISHGHTLIASKAAATTGEPANHFLAATSGDQYADGVNLYCTLPPNTPGPNATLDPAAVMDTGGSQPHNNLQPYMCLNYIIALRGIFPSQS